MNQRIENLQEDVTSELSEPAGDILAEGHVFTSAEVEELRRLAIDEERHSGTDAAHVRRVAQLAFHLAILAGLRLNTACALRHAAALHDIGKHMVPLEVLNKAGSLTPHERVAVESHAAAGAKLLQGKGAASRLATEVAHYHHEWWNGLGYPAALCGKGIPLSARIVAIADVFDALVSVRCYKPAWSVSTALLYIEQRAGTQFDPELAHLFVDFIQALRKKWADKRSQSVAAA